MLSVAHCCCGGQCPGSCVPCCLPKHDLTLTITPGTSYTLSYIPGTTEDVTDPDVWRYSTTGSDPYFNLSCYNSLNDGVISITGRYLGLDFNNSSILSTTSCNPYAIDINSSWFATTLVVTDPSPDTNPAGCTTATPQVTGCNGLPLPGATYKVWNSSAKTTMLFTGTTDSAGQVGPWDFPVCGSYWREISAPRFTTLAGRRRMVGDFVDQMADQVDSGYHCSNECPYPEPDTLHGTHSVLGAITYTYDEFGPLSLGWYATVSYSYPGCYCCPAKTVTVNCFLDPSFIYQESWKSD